MREFIGHYGLLTFFVAIIGLVVAWLLFRHYNRIWLRGTTASAVDSERYQALINRLQQADYKLVANGGHQLLYAYLTGPDDDELLVVATSEGLSIEQRARADSKAYYLVQGIYTRIQAGDYA